MTPDERAVAWLDAHPEVVEAAAKVLATRWGRRLLTANHPSVAEALVAFLTTPLPCAFCTPEQGDERRCGFCGALVGHFHALDCSTYGPGGYIGPRPQAVVEGTECDHCTDGTAGILLDQLEARYEQVGWRDAGGGLYRGILSSGPGPRMRPEDEPVFRKLPSPGAD